MQDEKKKNCFVGFFEVFTDHRRVGGPAFPSVCPCDHLLFD